MLRAVAFRASGEHASTRLEEAVCFSRVNSLGEDATSELLASAAGPVTCVALDRLSQRFLLTVDTRSTVLLHDTSAVGTGTVRPSPPTGMGGAPMGYDAIARYPRSAPMPVAARSAAVRAPPPLSGHNRAISCVAWFPSDTGLFLTGAADNRLLTWDTARFSPAYAFAMDARVLSVAVSPCAGRHNLVAVGTEDPRVRLVDLATAGHAHTLVGHRDAVVAIAWHPTSEFVLTSGGRDGSIRVWDVRRSGATAQLAALDQHVGPTQRAQGRAFASAAALVAGGALGTSAMVAAFSGAGITDPSAFGTGPVALAHAPGVSSVSFLPGSSQPAHLLSTGVDGSLRCWALENIASGIGRAEEEASDASNLNDGRAGGIAGWNTLKGYPAVASHVRHRALFPVLASYGRGSTQAVAFIPASAGVAVLDVDTGEELGLLRGGGSGVNALAWSDANQALFAGDEDGHVVRWMPKLLAGGRGVSGGEGER